MLHAETGEVGPPQGQGETFVLPRKHVNREPTGPRQRWVEGYTSLRVTGRSDLLPPGQQGQGQGSTSTRTHRPGKLSAAEV